MGSSGKLIRIGKIGIPAYVIVKDILVSRTPDQWEMKDGKIPYIDKYFLQSGTPSAFG